MKRQPHYRRYKKKSIPWSFRLLDDATSKVDEWLQMHGVHERRGITLDIAVPSLRCNLEALLPILQLMHSEETVQAADCLLYTSDAADE